MANLLCPVCIVDDDPGIRESLRYMFEDDGYVVVEVEDGLAALDLLRHSEERLVVLLDVMMPKLDGIGVLRQVVAEPAEFDRHAYVLITANHQNLSQEALDLLQQLAIPIITKPFNLDDVQAAVDHACASLI